MKCRVFSVMSCHPVRFNIFDIGLARVLGQAEENVDVGIVPGQVPRARLARARVGSRPLFPPAIVEWRGRFQNEPSRPDPMSPYRPM